MAQGMIDIHTHIIPGLDDDGARSVDESDAMIKRYVDSGFETVIATPHIELSGDASHADKLDDGYSETASLANEMGINLLKGAELRLTPEIGTEMTATFDPGLGGTKYVLVDFPSGSWPFYAEDSIFLLQMKGFIPVLAHPERYGWGSDDRDVPSGLVQRGVLLQVTLGSLVGAFGSQPQRTARELLRSGFVHFTATDAHSAGSRLQAAMHGIEWMRKVHGDGVVEQTLMTNPANLLSGGVITPFYAERTRGFWINFGFRRLFTR